MLSIKLNPFAPPPENWRVFFVPDAQRILAEKLESLGHKNLRSHIGSWIIARLGHLHQISDEILLNYLDEDELRLPLEIYDVKNRVAALLLVISDDEVRLVGRMMRSDLLNAIQSHFIESLVSAPNELDAIQVTLPSGVQLGYVDGQFLGVIPPQVDYADLVDRILEGQPVPRWDDNSEELCPMSRTELIREYVFGLKNPPVQPPSVEYVQSVLLPVGTALRSTGPSPLPNKPGWLFKIRDKRRTFYALVHTVKGETVLEWCN